LNNQAILEAAASMNNKQMYKKLWLLPVLIIAFKLLLASSLWNFLSHYISREILILLGSLWLAKLILVPLLGLLVVRLWKKSNPEVNAVDETEAVSQT
jgi:hypothetical protein